MAQKVFLALVYFVVGWCNVLVQRVVRLRKTPRRGFTMRASVPNFEEKVN